jgi:menaquinone-dependent protoporphyrinogen IX oxidase
VEHANLSGSHIPLKSRYTLLPEKPTMNDSQTSQPTTFISIDKNLKPSTQQVKQTTSRLTEMSKALVIYHSENDDTKLLAQKIAKRLEDLSIQVAISQDKQFKDFESIHEYDVIALGASCLTCRKCHGAEECRAPKLLRRNIKKLFKMNLKDKKLITFATSTEPEKHEWVRKRIEALIAPTGIKPIASIGYAGKTPDNLDAILATTIKEQMIH